VPDYDRFDRSSLKWMMTGAAPVPPSLVEQYNSMGVGIQQVYGLTETCGPACLMDAENSLKHPASTGKAFFHTEVKIADDGGNEVPRGTAGEVLVKGEHVMVEYWNRPEATRETIKDGWLYTGDVAIMDEAGFVTIQDRIKDMIISGGENVYPAEIEGLLATHPGIREAAVIGQESARWGESPLAIVVRSDDALTAGDVLEFCQGKLARFKQPQVVEFVEEIPRNPSGKILKRVLREQFDRHAPI
jgi:acyl-CoA synthetase (AMP-forming)/AMP-acid ligase II